MKLFVNFDKFIKKIILTFKNILKSPKKIKKIKKIV